MKKKKTILPKESLLSEMDQLKVFGGVSVSPLSYNGCTQNSCTTYEGCETHEKCPVITYNGCTVIKTHCIDCWGTKKEGTTDQGCNA